ncbi:carbohydrate ABC transporter permease [Streptomyces boninensis]|uniref:carbohydrate ABC transporter permease n=1 Tax=Streptomyces boninensis TaxID=2039455 RepID=UPI003B21464A
MSTLQHSEPVSRAAAPPDAPPPRWRLRPRRTGGSGFPFVVPFLVFFVLFLLVPIGYGIWMSFTDAALTGQGDGELVGFGNYAEALTDPEVWRTLGNTVVYTVLAGVPMVVVPLAMALLVNTHMPAQWLWRLSFFAPYLLPVAVMTLIWTWLYQPDLGLFNQVLGAFGMEKAGWLTDKQLAMASIALASMWWHAGFNFLLYLAALQGIPDHLHEAASIDGAGAWRRLWSVTLPQLRHVTGVIAALQVMNSMKVFEQIYLLTKGGPDGSTRSVLGYVFDTGFTGYRLGYAAAISNLFFALIVIVSLAQVKFSPRKEDQD